MILTLYPDTYWSCILRPNGKYALYLDTSHLTNLYFYCLNVAKIGCSNIITMIHSVSLQAKFTVYFLFCSRLNCRYENQPSVSKIINHDKSLFLSTKILIIKSLHLSMRNRLWCDNSENKFPEIQVFFQLSCNLVTGSCTLQIKNRLLEA